MTAARGILLCAILALAGLLGCQSLLGDFEIRKIADDTGCEGDYRCSEGWLFCAGSGGGDWTLIATCGSADQCDSTLGRCTVCDAGDYRCNDTKLETCNAERSGWSVVKTCATADECNLNSRTCRACTPGEPPMCAGTNQTELRQCAADQTWQSLGTCATKELCAASVEAAQNNPGSWAGACQEPGCPAAGAYACDQENGLDLLRCAPSLTGYVKVDTCLSAELCASTAADPVLADSLGGKCVTPICYPAGSFRCSGEQLEQCLDDLLGWGLVEKCELPFQCNTNEQACAGPCTPGERQCSGATLETCSNRQLWAEGVACVSAGLCSVSHDPISGEWSGACLEPACPEPNAHRCTDAGVLEICAADQTAWLTQATCRSSALCNALDGRCDDARCEPGALRCNDENISELLGCRADLTDWESVAVCASTQSCNTDAAGPPCIDQCPDPPERCNGAVREDCSGVSGVPVWTSISTCRSRELCQCGIQGNCPEDVQADGVCGVPVCGELLGGSRCEEGKLQLCLQGRNGFEEGTDCGSEALCVAGQPASRYYDGGYCAVCTVASEKSCNGATLRTCSADRRNWQSSMACGALGCIESGTADYCAECTPNDKRCSGGGVQTCNAQSRWGATVACDLTCVDSGTADYCADCTPNDKRCMNGGVQTCNAQSRWGATVACDLACVDSGAADYCADCTPNDKRCMNGGVQTCNAQSRWGAAVACDLECIDSGAADYCADCTPGEKRCATGGLQTCSAQSRWGAAMSCSVACVDVSGNADYCADCNPGETECATLELRTCGNDSHWSSELCLLACQEGDPDPDYCAACTNDEDCGLGGLCLLGLCIGL